ncbi:MAG: hypothetical protein AABY09_03985 [Nanoarchaeota archaeon]
MGTKKRLFLVCIILILGISNAFIALAELSPCSSGGLTTSVHNDYQMLYTDEDFLQIDNIDLLKDVSQLKDLACLQYMDATDRTIKGDIANLKNLKNLEVFSLYSNPEVYGDICSLAEATKLRSLKLAFNPNITGDISCLRGLAKLDTFAMTHTQVSGDLSVFANMPNLKAVYVSGTNVRGDICAFSKLANLEELGIADEYPGNPDIAGDLSCLDNLQKLKRVSIYNTGATNCEQFTMSHPDIALMGKTESGRPAGGGCSKESLKTLVDVAQKYERKIGKEVQTEVRGKPDYQREADFESLPFDSGDERQSKEPERQFMESGNQNFLAKFIDMIKSMFGRIFGRSDESAEQSRQPEDPNQIRPQAGPGGCKTQAECDAICSKPENKEACSKFAPPDEANQVRPTAGPDGCKTQAECDAACSKPENKEICAKFAPPESNREEGESDVRPNLEQGGPGGCKTQAECQAYCSKPENREDCAIFAPPD